MIGHSPDGWCRHNHERPEADNDGPWVLMAGNPVEGFEFIGPFPTHDDLTSYAEDNPIGDDWWSAPLVKPSAARTDSP